MLVLQLRRKFVATVATPSKEKLSVLSVKQGMLVKMESDFSVVKDIMPLLHP
jgi:hypothetical protein